MDFVCSSSFVLTATLQVIKLDPSYPLGYERKYEALRGARCYGDAIDTFETMLLKISQSSDPEICGECGYIMLILIY